jgi:MFS transporter, putative metabolite:H+ symporter
VIFSLTTSSSLLLFIVFIYGLVYGMSLPLSTTMMAEITPASYRGKSIVLINACICIGQISGIILVSCILETISSGNWRLIIRLGSLSSALLLYLSYEYLLESPRYILASSTIINSKNNEGIQILK